MDGEFLSFPRSSMKKHEKKRKEKRKEGRKGWGIDHAVERKEIENTGQGSSANRLRAHTEYHGDLVDNHLGAAQVVHLVEHVRSLELPPLHLP